MTFVGLILPLAASAEPTDTPISPPVTNVSRGLRGSDRPQLATFAVGDFVWRDDNRSGVQDPSESPAAQISVQLLNVDGQVVDSTVSGPSGRYIFDDLPAGTYSIRFAGVPQEFRLTPTAMGDQRMVDSDPDYSGMTPPFTLGADQPNVRPATPADSVNAGYLNPTIDAGITPLRYAVRSRVWQDLNGDGIQQTDEPAGSATVSLRTEADNVVATTTTDATGRYEFSNLRSGRYRLQFAGLPAHRALTQRAAGANPALDSDPDPATGRTPLFRLAQGTPNLVPVSDADAGATDFEDQTISAGLVGAYSVGDMVWRDVNGNGVLDAGEAGVAGVAVELLAHDSTVIARTVSSQTGHYLFDDLPARSYKIKFSELPDGLVFTCQVAGQNAAVDSDVSSTGMTAAFTLGDKNPDDMSIDAGLTAKGNYHPVPDGNNVPIQPALSTRRGIAPQIPLAAGALAVAGASCLLIALRRSH
jgi:hypothetical protein